MRNKHEAGFTLLEIMVVLVIIGILMSLIVPNIINKPDEARITVAKADLHAISNALDLYKLDHFDYPTTEGGLEALVEKSGAQSSTGRGNGGYLKKLPVDPWGNPYQYVKPGTHGEYDLYSVGPGGKVGQTNSAAIYSE